MSPSGGGRAAYSIVTNQPFAKQESPATGAGARHRNLVRRDRRRRVRPGARACSRTRSTARSACTRTTAASCRSLPRATMCASFCRWSARRSAGRPCRRGPRRRRLYGGPGLVGALLVGRDGRALAGLGARTAGDRRPPHGRPSAGAAARSGPARAAVRRAAGLGRTFDADRGRGDRALRAARRHARRCGRRGLRQDRQADGSAVSRRPGARRGSPSRAGRACSASRGR